jgi:hypothetical protein
MPRQSPRVSRSTAAYESIRLRREQATREGNERVGARNQEAISRALVP